MLCAGPSELAPGFIRRFNFTDGPHATLFALWRTLADAHAFFATEQHQTAMSELFRHRWQYSHFCRPVGDHDAAAAE